MSFVQLRANLQTRKNVLHSVGRLVSAHAVVREQRPSLPRAMIIMDRSWMIALSARAATRRGQHLVPMCRHPMSATHRRLTVNRTGCLVTTVPVVAHPVNSRAHAVFMREMDAAISESHERKPVRCRAVVRSMDNVDLA